MHQLLLIIIYGHCFNGRYLIKSNISNPKTAINLCISGTLGPQLSNLNPDVTRGNYLFGPVKLSKNAHPDKYKYTGCCIGFYSRSEFLFTDEHYGKNVIIFGAELICACL